jgi:hypothetical protein
MRGPALAGIMILAVVLGACGSVGYGKPTGAASAHSREQHVGASGMVIGRSAADATFCSGLVPANFTGSPPRCSAGIRLAGVNLSVLADRRTSKGVIFGSAYLAGNFRSGILHVSEQGPPRPDNTRLRLADPPCPAPAAGWATTTLNQLSTSAVTAYRRRFPSDLTSVAVFHPRPGTWVVTLASANPRRTTAKLSEAYLDQLCVVRSR